jgi:hypothetical protein
MGCNYMPNKEQNNTSRPAEEVAREIVNSLFVEVPTAREWDIVEALIPAITAAIEAERKERIEVERQRDNLLCRIHRDGGHYIHDHGIRQALCDADEKVAILNAESDTWSQRLKDAEKWMRHLDGCALGSRIAYNSITKSFCTCGLDDFRKEK